MVTKIKGSVVTASQNKPRTGIKTRTKRLLPLAAVLDPDVIVELIQTSVS
jgi:hypothetical protein